MVEKVTVTIWTELTKYGEVEFSVKSHKGLFKRKCLHDALSEADIKMTGIDDMIKSFTKKLKHVEHFAVNSQDTRLYDEIRETEERTRQSVVDIESTVEHSVHDVPVKHTKSSKSRTKRREAVLS
jgi:hypothetical protein